MRKQYFLIIYSLLFISYFSQAQTQQTAKPKLVIGIVIDQMRWDFLYRYADRYTNNGFKRLLREGFSCENTMVPYTPTVTACGHTCIYTGSVPAITGITGNNWWDLDLNKRVYCTDDSNFTTVGSNSTAGQMSPNNMLVTTIGDELRMATNFRSKVIGIAIKDRGAILPAGHSANGAYWYDDQSGNWITSSYYRSDLPDWASQFNNRKLVDSLLVFNWNTLDSANKYIQSTEDNKNYEVKFPGEISTAFPHNFSTLTETQKDTAIKSIPQGNTMTLEFAKSAIEGESLGMTGNTDFLTISCSSTDYIGHQFGPNSVENEDDYLRLDKDLASFFKFLDDKYGAGNYLLFLTADHGVAHIPGFLQENKIPSGFLSTQGIAYFLNANAKSKFGLTADVILNTDNYQLTLNHSLLDSAKISRDKMISFLLPLIKMIPGVANEFDIEKISETTMPEVQKKMLSNGYYAKHCGDIQLIFQPGWIDGGPTGTTHGLWNPYDAHIPLIWFGWNVKQGATNKETYMTDIAATVAAMLHIQMPNGCIGKVIAEAMK
jgi:predicted AlkP superfamily pyrophosphatase or phosphodiesterase